MAAGARSIRKEPKARSAKSEHCSRTYLYKFVNAALAGRGAWAEQMRALAPASLVAKIQSGYVHFRWKGDTRLLKSMLRVPAGIDPDGV